MNTLLSKRNLISIIAVAIAFIFGFFIGDASAVNRIKKEISTNVSKSSSNQNTSQPPKQEKKELTLTDLGQEASLSQFAFKIVSVENSKEAKTPSKSIQTTNNNYVIVRLQYTNKRTAPAQIGEQFDFHLANTKTNATYNLNSDVTISMNSNLKIMDKQSQVYSIYDDVNPNLPAEIVLVFETTEQADNNFGIVLSSKTNKDDIVGLKLFK